MEPIEFGQFDLVLSNGQINGGASALQWGPDGLLYAVGRNGFIYAIEVTRETNGQGDTTGFTGEIKWTHDLSAPNFDDDGVVVAGGSRQALGIVVTKDDLTGETIVYASHSDIKIGAGGGGGSGDVGLDTNSGVITRIKVAVDGDKNVTENEALDLIRGLPRSEENHATNGLELTINANGDPILLIASGGHANAGAPSVNFVGLPEYTYSAAVLSADLNALAAIEAAKKSVDPDIDHVFDLPTLDDPTRPNFKDAQGADVWIDANFDGQVDTVAEFVDQDGNGIADWLLDQDNDDDVDVDDMADFVSTKIVDADGDDVNDTILYQEGGSALDNVTGVRGGNDALNQAKLLVGNPVQIFSTGYRNLYDVLKTEDGRFYAYDNGANGGWGGVAVTDNGTVTNEPNNVNETQNFDNLHEFSAGYHAGHPNPVVASGAAAGLWTSPTTGPNSSQTLPILNWRELSDTPLADIGQQDDGLVLPADWNEVVDPALINSAAGAYNEGGSVADGALDADKGSWNGLAEYTGTAFDGQLQGAILVTKTNGSNNVKWIKRDANGNIDVVAKSGDISNPNTIIEAADQGAVGSTGKGNTLGIDAVGDDGVDGSGLFNNTIWVGSLGGANKITIFEAGGEPAGADLDKDDDGVDHILDYYDFSAVQGFSHVLDPQGTTTEVNAGETRVYNLSAESYPLSGPGGIGQLGFMVNLADPSAEGGLLSSSDNVIPGGAGSGLQIKDIRSGTATGTSNDQKDALTFAVTPGADAGRLEISTVMNAILEGFYQNGSEAGLQIGTGDQFSFMSLVLAFSGTNTLEMSLHYEEGDIQQATQSVDVSDLLFDIGGVQRLPDTAVVEFLFDVDTVSGLVTPSFRISPDGNTTGSFTDMGPVQATGNVLQAIQGDFEVGGVPHPLAFGNIGTSAIAPDAPAGATENDNVNVTYDEFKVVGFAPQVDAFVVLSGGGVTVNEDAGTVGLTLELQDEFGSAVTLDEDVIVNFSVGGTALASDDYTLGAPSPVIIAASKSSALVTLTIVDDEIPEPDETIEISLGAISAGGNDVIAKAGADVGTITIDSDDAGNVLYRVNAGGPQVAADPSDPIQLAWAANQGTGPQSGTGFSVNTGNTSSHPINQSDPSVPNYVPQTIFTTERWDPPANPVMTWSFEVDAGGIYSANIFAGNGFDGTSEPGERVFNIEIEGVEVFSSIDLSQELGHQVGGVFNWTGAVLDDSLDIAFTGVTQNPTVNGFEIIEVSGQVGTEAEVSVADVVVNENAGTASVVFSLSSQIEDGPVTVPFTLVDGSAASGIDFSASPGAQAVMFDGSQTASATIIIENDDLLEGIEEFTVVIDGAGISAPTGVTITPSSAQGSATVTIIDDDVPPPAPGDVLYRVNTGGPEIAALDDGPAWGADTGDFGTAGNSPYLADAPTVSTTFDNGAGNSYPGDVENAIDVDASVPLAVFDTERGDRGAGAPTLKYSFDVASDFGLAPGDEVEVRLYFAEIFAGIEDAANDADMDGTPAGNRVFDVAVDGVVPSSFDDIDQWATAGANTGFVRSAIVAVDADGTVDLEFLNDVENPAIKAIEILVAGDAPQDVTITALDASADESTGEITLTFTISEAVPDGDITVPYTLVSDTATVGVDTTPNQDGSVTFPAGSSSDETVVITLNNDNLVEGDESFTVQLGIPTTAPANVNITTANGTATILDEDVAAAVDSFNGVAATGDDWSNINTAPDNVTLVEGAGLLVSTGSFGDSDYITFTVAAGQQVTAINLTDYVGEGNSAFLGIQVGETMPTQAEIEGGTPLNGGTVYNVAQLGTDILPLLASTSVENAGQPTTGLTTPLQEGTYTLWFNQNQDLTESTIEIVSEAVPGSDPTDIDDDGILNTDDPFAFDGLNGLGRVLAPGGEFRQDFNVDTDDPFDADGGFTGILVNPGFDYPNASGDDPYGDRTNEDKVSISGGALSVTSDIYDAFPTNNNDITANTLADGYQSGADVSGVDSFEVVARANSADWLNKANTTGGFEQFGIALGAGGVDDFVKLIVGDAGNNAPRVQVAHNNSLVGGENNYSISAPDANPPANPADGPIVDLSLVGDYELRLIVDKTAGANGQIVGQVDFFASADGALLASFVTPPADILPDSSLLDAMNGENPLTNDAGGLAYGIFVTDYAGGSANEITASYDFLSIRALGDLAPIVELQNQLAAIAEDTDLSTSLKVADIVITDDGVSTVTPTLSGDDSGLFTIVDIGGALELHLQAEALLDFETNPTLDVTVEATDAAGTGTAAFSVPVTDANDAPTITGTVADAATTVGTPTTVDLSALVLADEDVTDTPVLKVLIDGVDVGSVAGFTLNGTTLEVDDTVAIGDYAVEVFANDGEADSESAVTFSVGVGASSSPVPTLAVVVPTETEGDIVVTIDFGEPVFGLSASAVTLTNALGLSRTDGTTPFVDGDSTATLTFTAPAGGFAQDTTYTASILEGVVTDIDGNSNDAAASEPAAFGIDDGPVFVSGADDIDLAENTAGALATYQAVDADGDDVTYSLSPSGTTAGFQIDSISGLLTAPSFDFETQPTSYTFDVIASSTGSDAVAKTATQSVTVTILDESNENGTQSDDVIDIDEEQDVVVLSTGGDNSGGDDIVSGDTQTLDGLVIVNVEEGDGVEFDDEGIVGVEVLGLSQGSVLLDVDVDTGSGFDGVADAQIEISGSEITEEALNNGSLTENDFQVNGTQIVFAPVDETDTVEFEVEDFDDVFPINQSQDNQFFEENQGAASGGQVARLGSNDTGVATLQLGAGDGVIFGNNNIVVTYFDESDGVSTFELKINGVSAGSVTLDNDGGGNAAQSGNIRSATFNNVSVPVDAVVTLEGSSNLGEFLRLDKISFTSTGGGTGNPDNQAPIAVGTIDLSGLTQGDTINIPLEGASPIFVDPDEDAMIFSLSENAPDFLSIVDGVIINDRPITNQDVVDSAALGPIQVTVTASDGDATATSDFDVVVLNANDAPILVPENIGTLDLVTSENEITPIDASVYFDDPDFLISGNLEALEYEATGLPPELAIDPQTGIISGALTVPGSYAVSITATDLGDLSVTANFTINVTGEPVLGDPIRIQVEDFDNISDPGGFFVEGQGAADENQVARLGANGSGEATLALDDVSGFSPGSYNLTLGFFDENDGDSTVVVKIRTFDSGGVPSDTIVGTVVFDADAGGNAAQASSFRQVTLNGLTIPAGATLVLEGDAEGYDQAEADLDPDRTVGNEFVRLDYVDLIPTVGNPGNFAPFPIPGFDTALEAPEGNADFSVAAAFGDPEEDILSFALKALPNGDPLPDFLEIDPVTGIISMVGSSVSEDTTFEFEVTATDVDGSGQTATQTFTLLVTDVPLPSVAATVESSVIEGIDSFVAVALADTPTIQDPVTVRLVLVPGTSIPPATPGLDIAFDEFGATTIDVTFTQGAQGIVPLIVVDDGPIDDLESFRVEIIAANVGSTIDGGATPVPFAQFSGDGIISDADDAPAAVDEAQTVFAGSDVTFDPTASDTDADATQLTLVSIDTTATVGGTVTENPDGTVTVAADPGATGTISFGYTVADDFGNQTIGTEVVTITSEALISIAPTATAVEDGDTGTTPVVIDLTVTPAAAGTVDVEFSLDGGTTTSVATVTFDALGAGTLTVDVDGFNDAVDDGDDTATVTLIGSPTEGFAVDPSNAVSTATITEDDTLLPDTVVLRINAFGADQAPSDGGPTWLGDVTGGGAANYLQVTDDRGDDFGYSGDPLAIPHGITEEVLDTARSSDFAFSYAIPVSDLDGAGNYRVKLYVAELFGNFQGGGFRIFDSSLEGVVPAAFDDIDPGTQFGADVGVLTADVTVSDGTLNIAFVPEVAQFPIINGIEIIKLGGDPADVEGPTASIALTSPDSAAGALVVEITLADASGVSEASLGDEDIDVLVGEQVVPAENVTFVDFDGSVATYTVAPPVGGWLDGDEVSVTLVAGEVLDLAPGSNGNAETTEFVTLTIGDPPADASLTGDLDNDLTPNNADDDIDGDGISNLDDRAAYNASNAGPDLATVETIEFDFTNFADGTSPFEAGLDGVTQTADGTPEIDYATNNGAVINGGRLQFQTAEADTNDAENGFSFLADVSGGDFTFEGTFDNPVAGGTELTSFAQYGLIISVTGAPGASTGADGDFLKFTTGNPGAGLELSGRGSFASPDAKTDYPTGVTATNFAQVHLEVTAQNGAFSGAATYLDDSGATLGVANLGPISPTANSALANILSGASSVQPAFGVTSTDFGANGSFTVGVESLTLSDGAGDPPTNLDDAISILQAAQGVDVGGVYNPGDVGSAQLRIMEGVDNVQASNFGGNSFLLENTGDKQIAAVFIDFREALYSNSVIDPDGAAGDNVTNPFAAQSGAAATGLIASGNDNVLNEAESLFLPGDEPNPDPNGAAANGGFRGLLLRFDGSSGGFSNGEVVGFAGDMDPNSIANSQKSTVDSNAVNDWDVGGVSGAELIGSAITVMFDDGTFATGYLGSNGTQAGSTGTASQASPSNQVATVTVNGAGSGVQGVYGGTEPEIVVSGTPGATVLVTMSKGLNPVTNTASNAAQDTAARLQNSHPEFQASNAGDFQTVQVTIGANGTFTLQPGAFDYNQAGGGITFDGSAFTEAYATAPMVIAASVVDSNGEPSGPVDRVYLASNGVPVDPVDPPIETGGYFEGNGNPGGNYAFKVQIENASEASGNGGLDPNGQWTFFDAPDPGNFQQNFQGEGYYLYGSTSSLANNQQPGANEILEFTILIPEGAEGTYTFRMRVARDQAAESDKQNDAWINFQKQGTNESIEEYLTNGEPEPLSQGFLKLFGGPNNGQWGFATQYDQGDGGPATQLAIDEPGLYTIQIAGRSQGFHIDYWELFKGNAPGVGASNSDFIVTGPSAPTLDDPIEDVVLVAGNGTSIDAASAFSDLDGDDLDFLISAPNGITIDEETGLITVENDLAVGTYTVTVTAFDDDNNQVSDTFDIEVVDQLPENTIVVPIATSNDDWEERGGSASNDLELGENGGQQYVALRFIDIDVPAGSTITNAFIRFTAQESNNAPAEFTIAIEESDQAAPYSSSNAPVSVQRTLIKEFTWVPEGWTAGQQYETPPVTDQVASVIGSDGVTDGNLSFVIEGIVGSRVADSFNTGGENQPELVITYGSVSGEETQPEVVDPLDDINLVVGTGTSFDASVAFDDADGDNLQYLIQGPLGVSINAETGVVVIPSSLAEGVYSITVTAVDDDNNFANDIFNLSVNPQNSVPSVVDPIDDVTLSVGSSASFDVSIAFEDLDGDDLDFEITGPAGIFIDQDTGFLTIGGTLAIGSYQATVTAFDDDDNEISDTFTISVVAPSSSETVSVSVSNNNDDWEEFGGKKSGDFELGENDGTQQWAALRFEGLDIPAGALITSAIIRFTAQGNSPGTGIFEVGIEDTESSAGFGASSPDPDNRVYVDEFVWTETTDWIDDQTYDTPDLSALLAGVVGSDGVSDGAVAFIFEGVSGSKVADTFNQADGVEPELIVTYDLL
ncbi:MAG: putative Ig domain-containing protein [Pseudomonadota bacterium]